MAFRIAALIILPVFYGCYFAKMVGQRRKGIQTNQMGKGKTGIVKVIEYGLKIFSILTVAAELVSVALGVSALPLWGRCVGQSWPHWGQPYFQPLCLPWETAGGPVCRSRTEPSW